MMMIYERNWKVLAVSLLLGICLLEKHGHGLTPSSPSRRCVPPRSSPGQNRHHYDGRRIVSKNGHEQARKETQRNRPITVAVSRLDEETMAETEKRQKLAAKRTPTTAEPVIPPLMQAATTTRVPQSFTTNHEIIQSLSPSQIERKIVTLGRKGQISEALKIYKSLEKPTIRQMNAIIDACSRARPVRLNLAFEILQTAPVEPNVYTFGSLMNVCARAGSVKHAIQLLKSMEQEYGVAPNAVVYNTAVSACGRANPPQFSVALQLLQQAKEKGLRMSVVGYNAAISAAAHAGDWQGALDLLQQMEQTKSSSTTVLHDDDAVAVIPRPDAVSYGTVLSAFEREGKWERILEFAEYMQSIGQPLDGLSITSVLHACQRLGLAQEAVRYLNLMKESAARNEHVRQTAGWEMAGGRKPLDGPDAVAYLLAISACARGGDWIRGIELLNDYYFSNQEKIMQRTGGGIGDNEIDVNIFTAAIKGCEYAGQWEEAFLLLERMRKMKIQPNDVAFAAVIGACATACAKLQTNHENKEKGNDKTTPPANGIQLLDPKKKALRLLAVMHKDASVISPTTLVYNAAIRACAEAHDLKNALKLFETMQSNSDQDDEEAGHESDNMLKPNVVTFGSLMTACERVGSTEGMDTVFHLLKKSGLKANDVIYGAAISCCRKAGGDGKRAFLLLQKMVKEGIQPNIATINTALMAQAEARNTVNLARAYQWLRSTTATASSTDGDSADDSKSNEKGGQIVLSSKPNRQTFNIIIRGFADKKQATEAETVLHDMRASGFPPDVDLYTLVVSAYERTGQPLQALRLMESMNKQGYAFYEDKVLNAAFKRLLKMANMLGQRLSTADKLKQPSKSVLQQVEENEEHFDVEDGTAFYIDPC